MPTVEKPKERNQREVENLASGASSEAHSDEWTSSPEN
jgi:hypothetical protein